MNCAMTWSELPCGCKNYNWNRSLLSIAIILCLHAIYEARFLYNLDRLIHSRGRLGKCITSIDIIIGLYKWSNAKLMHLLISR